MKLFFPFHGRLLARDASSYFFSVAKYITLKLFLKFVLQTQSDIFITENLRVIYKFFQEKRN